MSFSIQQFITDAYALNGIPFFHGGTNPATGLDCINTPKYLVSLQGVEVFDFGVYSENPDPDVLLAGLRRCLWEITEPDTRAGDLYLFRFWGKRRHVGIRLTDEVQPLFLHPMKPKLVLMPLSEQWASFATHWFRLPWAQEGPN